MQRRALGLQGLQSSAQGFGAMSLSLPGNEVSEAAAVSLLQRALDLGISLIDTAAYYGEGHNEKLIGKAIKGRPRDSVIVADKVGPIYKDGKMEFDCSAAGLREQLHSSLQHLQVEYIDLWILRGMQNPDVEQAFKDMKVFVDEAKVRYLGLSEVTPEDVKRAHAIHPVSAVEVEWSLFSRDAEEDLVPLCREIGAGFLCYTPLGRGLLTGLLPKPEALPNSDYRKHMPRVAGDAYRRNMLLVGELMALAKKKGCTAGQLALAWLHHQGPDVIPFPGTKQSKYLEENVAAASIKLTAAEIKELEDAVPYHQVVGDRNRPGIGTTYRLARR